MEKPFATYARTLYDSGLGEVFPLYRDTKKPRSWVKPKLTFDGPLEGGGRHTVTAKDHEPVTARRVNTWVKAHPDDLPGLVPAEEVVVFDIDQHDGKHGAESLAAALGVGLADLGRMLKPTLHSSARRDETKGWAPAHGHWFFTVPKGTILRRQVPSIKDVEVIGPGRRGFYIVAPGAVHEKTGNVYTLDAKGKPVAVDDIDLSMVQPCPQVLLDLYGADEESQPREPREGDGTLTDAEAYARDPYGEPDKAVREVLDRYTDEPDEDGTHHGTMLATQQRLARQAEEGHAGVWTALGEAREAFTGYCETVSRDGEVEWEGALAGVTVRLEHMRQCHEEGVWGPPLPDGVPEATVLTDEAGEPVTTGKMTDAQFWQRRVYLAWALDVARSHGLSPWAVLAAVLTRAAASVPANVQVAPVTTMPFSLNIFVNVAGHPGTGKSQSKGVVDHKLRVRNGVDYYAAKSLPTGEGLMHLFVYTVKGGKGEDGEQLPPRSVQANESVLVSVDEVLRFKTVSERTGGQTIIDTLNTAWGGGELGTENATVERQRQVPERSYRLAVYVNAQPEVADIMLTDQGNGFAQRWLWFEAYDAGMLKPDELPAIPEDWFWEVPSVPCAHTPGSAGKPVAGPFEGDDVRHIGLPKFVAGVFAQERYRGNLPMDQEPTGSNHNLPQRVKVAALLALLDRRTTVNLEDWQLARHVLRHSSRTRGKVQQVLSSRAAKAADRKAERQGRSAAIADEAQDESAEQRAVKRLRTRLQKAADDGEEGGWLGGSPLRRSLRFNRRDCFEGALQRLVDAGEVEARQASSGSSAGHHYRLVSPARAEAA
ncbi:MAG: bifunctional DNA primase/polymerase [Nocardioidaceae bacterium]